MFDREFHLSERHLHFKLFHRAISSNNRIEVARVLSNVDEYFFSHKFENVSLEPKYLELSKDYFCLIDTPPWIKWYTYFKWEEELEEDYSRREDELLLKNSDYLTFENCSDDVEYFIGDLVKNLASFYRVSVQLDAFYHYRIKTVDDSNKSFDPGLSPLQAELAVGDLQLAGYYICQEKTAVYYSQLTLGTVISSVGNILFRLKLKEIRKENASEVLCCHLLGNIISSFSELVFNPYAYSSRSHSLKMNDEELRDKAHSVCHFLSVLEKGLSEAELIKRLNQFSNHDPVFWSSFSSWFCGSSLSKCA